MKELKVMKKSEKKAKTVVKVAKKKVKHEKMEVKAHKTLRGSRIY